MDSSWSKCPVDSSLFVGHRTGFVGAISAQVPEAFLKLGMGTNKQNSKHSTEHSKELPIDVTLLRKKTNCQAEAFYDLAKARARALFLPDVPISSSVVWHVVLTFTRRAGSRGPLWLVLCTRWTFNLRGQNRNTPGNTRIITRKHGVTV